MAKKSIKICIMIGEINDHHMAIISWLVMVKDNECELFMMATDDSWRLSMLEASDAS